MIKRETILNTKLIAHVHLAADEIRLDLPSIINVFENEGYLVNWTNFEQILMDRINREVVGKYPATQYTKLMIVDGLVKLAGHLHVTPKELLKAREEKIIREENPQSIEDLSQLDIAAVENYLKKRREGKITKNIVIP